MQTGERIAIKAAYVKKHGLPFETWGNTVSVMAIKATGVIAENMGDRRRLRVHWQRVSPVRRQRKLEDQKRMSLDSRTP